MRMQDRNLPIFGRRQQYLVCNVAIVQCKRALSISVMRDTKKNTNSSREEKAIEHQCSIHRVCVLIGVSVAAAKGSFSA